jgi:hypothetical protein
MIKKTRKRKVTKWPFIVKDASAKRLQGVSSMKSRENLLRLRHFQVEDRTRQLTQIELMIVELSRMADELDRQIGLEEERSGITDISHFAYPTFAKAARQRRDNLAVSIRDLTEKRVLAEEALAEAEDELRKAQRLDDRDTVPDAETSGQSGGQSSARTSGDSGGQSRRSAAIG